MVFIWKSNKNLQLFCCVFILPIQTCFSDLPYEVFWTSFQITQKSSCNCANTVTRLPYTLPSKPKDLSAVGCRCVLPTLLQFYQYIICVKAIGKAVLYTSSPPSSLSRIFSSPSDNPIYSAGSPQAAPFSPSGCTQRPQSPGPAWSTAAAGYRGRQRALPPCPIPSVSLPTPEGS